MISSIILLSTLEVQNTVFIQYIILLKKYMHLTLLTVEFKSVSRKIITRVEMEWAKLEPSAQARRIICYPTQGFEWQSTWNQKPV